MSKERFVHHVARFFNSESEAAEAIGQIMANDNSRKRRNIQASKYGERHWKISRLQISTGTLSRNTERKLKKEAIEGLRQVEFSKHNRWDSIKRNVSKTS
jgi:hypothetical protein